jgi:cytochrome P450
MNMYVLGTIVVEEGNLRTWRPDRMYVPSPSWIKYSSDVKKLNDYVSGLVVRRWELRQREAASGDNGRKKDVLDKVMSSIDPAEWGPAWIKQIRDELKTFILAGHETSASMLTWSLYELISNKELLAKIRAEAKTVFHGDARTLSTPPKADLDRLVFSECCLRESLRKYSNVPSVVRMSSESLMVGDYWVPKGSTMMLCLQAVHHNPELWPEPMKWQPERFLKEVKPYSFVAFAEGPRMCLGQYLALLESKIVLAMLMNTYDFELVNKETGGEKHPFMVPIIPKEGHFVKVH